MEWAGAGNVLPVMPPMTEGQRESHRENTVGLSLSIVKEPTALTHSWRVEPLLLNHSVKAYLLIPPKIKLPTYKL